jgi:ABC-type transport system involved in multi-copper enzyme maturation permease subunit
VRIGGSGLFGIDRSLGALLKRELLTNLRNSRSFGLVLITVGFGVFVVYYNLPEQMRITQAAATAEGIFLAFSGVLLGAAILFVAPLAAISVCTEKQQDTFEMLQATPISPTAIILGKALNTLGIYLIIILASLPIVGTLFFLIGIDWMQFTQAMILIVSTCLTFTMIGVLCSTWFYNSIAAILATFLGIVGLMMGLPIFLQGSAMGVIGPMYGESGSLWVLLPSLFFEGIVIVVCFIGARQSLFRISPFVAAPPPPLLTMPMRPPGARPSLAGRPGYRSADFSARYNPIFLKEYYGTRQLRQTVLIICFPFLCIVFFALSAAMTSGNNVESSAPIWILVETGLLMLIAPGLIATALSREYAHGTLDSLRATLIPPRQIITGHLGAALVNITPVIVCMLIGAIPIFISSLWDFDSFVRILAAHGTMLVCVLLVLSIGMMSAILAQRATVALLLSYCLTLLFGMGLSGLTSTILDAFFRTMPMATRQELISVLSPLLYYNYVLELSGDNTAQFLLLWGAGMLAYCLLAIALLMVAYLFFLRFRIRER